MLNFKREVALCLYYTAIREQTIFNCYGLLIRTNMIFEFSEIYKEIYNSQYSYWLPMVTNLDRKRQVRVSFD